MPTLREAIEALAPKVADSPTAMLGLARLLQKDGQTARALALCREALALAPRDRKLAAQVAALVNATVPSWHFNILRDEKRNAAYDAALRRAVRPGSRVLDIGSGSGLLAMMAARAGAAEVIACEVNPAIAEKTAEIVRRNGYADRVRVVAKHSGSLDAEADLAGRVDVIVSEIVSNDLLGQDILAVHEHAVRHFLKPGGRVIPARGTVRVALAHDASEDLQALSDIAGFDLSAFGALAPPVHRRPVGDKRLSLSSDPADLFAFDLGSARHCPPAEASTICRSSGSPVNGVAQWIRIELDDGVHYENQPATGASSCWAARFHPLAAPIHPPAGQAIEVHGRHDRASLLVWL